MPKYNLSPDEARKLADYFAAKDGSRYPYPFTGTPGTTSGPGRRTLRPATGSVAEAGSHRTGRTRLPAGTCSMRCRIVTSDSYCVKCHRVGDFRPPDGNASRRLICRSCTGDCGRTTSAPGSPSRQSVLPVYQHAGQHSLMIRPPRQLGSTVPQDLYHGTSLEQLDALVDLLMNFDQYARQRSRVTPLVEEKKK